MLRYVAEMGLFVSGAERIGVMILILSDTKAYEMVLFYLDRYLGTG